MNKWIIILLFCFFNHFWGMLPDLRVISIIVLVIYGTYSATQCTTLYRNVFLLFVFGAVCSMVSCKIYRGQSLFESLKAMQSYYCILFYFILKVQKVKIETAEAVLLMLIYTLDVLYIAQYYLLPYGYNFLGIDEWMISDDTEFGGTRLRVMSQGLYIVGVMYGLSKWYITKERKYLPLFFLGVFIMLLCGYRQLIASLFVTVIYMFYVIDGKIKAKQFKYLVLLAVIAFIVYMIPEVQEKLQGMIARNVSGQTLNDSDYIRVIQYEFFTNSYFSNEIEHFFGSGIPYGTSSFGRWFEIYRQMGMQYVDWGIIGVSWVIGIPTAIAIIWMFIKGIRTKVSPQYKYCSLYLFFLLTTCITNWEMFRNGNFLVHALILYIIEQANFRYIQTNINSIAEQ